MTATTTLPAGVLNIFEADFPGWDSQEPGWMDQVEGPVQNAVRAVALAIDQMLKENRGPRCMFML